MASSSRKLLQNVRNLSNVSNTIFNKSNNICTLNGIVSENSFCGSSYAKTTSFHTSATSNSYMVPIVVEQTGRGERSYDIYSRLLKGKRLDALLSLLKFFRYFCKRKTFYT